ncbi:MAG: 3-deoxy-manno-octulosonate cytidylyltransferase [Fermentimonas sp.]|jgi:3-deoxy-manno-octulosonate cytidylyltransferase (CMP-KDO synthetase)|nr:3-deoxy-manno-octulosonate cytidylyltransferase [Fermentimonas sp.]MDD4696297.1 3-deoxy-manno-octulosonate cytidylyltransferase [Fermentimonas sp.]
MRIAAIIPARYASSRFPGKPLADMGGKPMIRRVYEQVQKVLPDLYVATDDMRIFEAVQSFQGNVVMTSQNHRSGTDRCREAITKIDKTYDVVLNIQGDEPFILPSQINSIISCFTDPEVEIATLVKPFEATDSFEKLFNPLSPKVVINKNNEAIYFSRSVIPYIRDVQHDEWLSKHQYFKHIGVYGYRTDILEQITQLSPSELEKAESLEQLRWIENGFRIKVAITNYETISIDTPEDLKRALEYLRQSE